MEKNPQCCCGRVVCVCVQWETTREKKTHNSTQSKIQQEKLKNNRKAPAVVACSRKRQTETEDTWRWERNEWVNGTRAEHTSRSHTHTPQPSNGRTLNAAQHMQTKRRRRRTRKNYTRRYDDKTRNENKNYIAFCSFLRSSVFADVHEPPTYTTLYHPTHCVRLACCPKLVLESTAAVIQRIWRTIFYSYVTIAVDINFSMRLERDGIYACDLAFFSILFTVCERRRVCVCVLVTVRE